MKHIKMNRDYDDYYELNDTLFSGSLVFILDIYHGKPLKRGERVKIYDDYVWNGEVNYTKYYNLPYLDKDGNIRTKRVKQVSVFIP